jgi:hypothetical protein
MSKRAEAVSINYVYAIIHARSVMVGLARTDPTETGGVVFWQFETDEPDFNKRLQLAEQLAPPFRIENVANGEVIATPRPASTAGLDEALMEGGALARVNPARALQLVGGVDTVIHRWN